MPTLCHLEGLSERGGCRLCMVEMEGSPRLFAACVTPVQEDMVVYTHTERLINYRRMILELLFSERNHYCAVCVMNGHCELQTQAAENGMTTSAMIISTRTCPWTPATSAMCWTITAASSAPVAFACATRSKARMCGT